MHEVSLYLDGLNAVQDPLRDAQANNILFEAGVGLDGHHSGDDGTGDADGPTCFDPVQKQRDVKEQLRDNEVCASVDLLLQEPQVLLHGGRLGVLLWVARHSDAKVVAMGLADVANQIGGVVETTLASGPFGLTMGGIATKRQNVLVATSASLLKVPRRMMCLLGRAID